MTLLSPLVWLGAAIALGAVYAYTCLRPPLRRIPGPPISLFTSWPLKWHEFRANRTRYVHDLHEKYGPVVRVAPNEVVFGSAGAVKEIYCSGGSGYDKTEFYDLFMVYGRRTMFTTLNKGDHAKRRRILADRYANSNVMRGDAIQGIDRRSKNFVQRCYDSIGGSLDLYVTLHAYAFDCVTHHLFHPYGVDSLQVDQDEAIMREVAFDSSLQNRLIRYYNPTLHAVLGRALAVWGITPRETPLADTFVLGAAARTDPAPFSLLSRMSEKAQGLAPPDRAAEALDHMAAGIDTTGDGLCFLLWELSQPGEGVRVQKRLREELRKQEGVSVEKLPYLDAVVMEGLRCYPPIPMSLPRYVPAGGRRIEGFNIPGGTVVSCQAYSVHRLDAVVFPEPDRFVPERWLEADGDAERKRLFFAFANGGRGCIGKHLALAEMKVLLRDIYLRFSTTPDGSMTTEQMVREDQLISSRPCGQKCLVKFEEVQE